MTVGINFDRLVKKILSCQFHEVIARLLFNQWQSGHTFAEKPTHSFKQVLEWFNGIVNMPFSTESTSQKTITWDLLAKQVIFSVSDGHQRAALNEAYGRLRDQHTKGRLKDNGFCKDSHGGVIMTLFGLNERTVWPLVQSLAESEHTHNRPKGDRWAISDPQNLRIFLHDPDEHIKSVPVDGTFLKTLSQSNAEYYVTLLIAEAQPLTALFGSAVLNRSLAQIFTVQTTSGNWDADISLKTLQGYAANAERYIGENFAWDCSAANVGVFEFIRDNPDREEVKDVKKSLGDFGPERVASVQKKPDLSVKRETRVAEKKDSKTLLYFVFIGIGALLFQYL